MKIKVVNNKSFFSYVYVELKNGIGTHHPWEATIHNNVVIYYNPGEYLLHMVIMHYLMSNK